MENSNAFIKTFPVTWIVTIIGGVIIYFIGDAIMSVSFLLGSVTSLMMMSMLFRSTNKILLSENKIDAQKQSVRSYALRYLFYTIILVTAAIHPNINILFTAGGLFVFKICLYIVLFFENRGGKK